MIQIIPDKLAAELRKKTLVQYCLMKFNEEDWHGVQDAASDIREVEVLINHFDRQERFAEAQKNADVERIGRNMQHHNTILGEQK